jgi:hypothetical protein
MPVSTYFPATKHLKSKVESVFGPKANGTLASKIYREDKALYDELRADAQALGLLGPVREHVWSKNYQKTERQYTPDEIRARARFSETEVRELFQRSGQDGGKRNLGTIQKDNPAEYELLKVAAQSYGVLPPRQDPPAYRRGQAPKPVEQVEDGKVSIGADLARRANLPESLRVNQSDLNAIVEAVADVELARREAAKSVDAGSGESK